MSDFVPSAAQAAAIAEVRDWFENRTEGQQVFRLFGYAGSGKSTVLKFALDDLGLSPHRSARDGRCVPGVVTATFTGKAALVLSRKGTPARTIHSLIYSVIEATEEEIAAAAAKVQEAETAARKLTGFDRTAAEAGIEAMRQALSAMKHPRFALNPQSDAADARLIVLDEVSMVGEEMARDLMSFGKPILVLGDPGQLPPIKGEGAFTRDAPDVMLTEIYRQAAESAIIRLATMARMGEPIGFGVYDAHVAKLRKGDITPDQALRGGQLDLRPERDAPAVEQRDARGGRTGRDVSTHRDGGEDHLPEERQLARPDQRDVPDPRGYRRRGQPLLLGRGA